MGDDFKDGLGIVILCTMVVFGLLLIFMLPILAVAALPAVAIYIGYVKHRDSPTRKEDEARAHLTQLYERAKVGTLAALTKDQINSALSSHLPGNTPENVEDWLLEIGRDFLRQLDLVMDVPSPPLIAYGIEGGRYQDRLAKIGTRSPDYVNSALDDLSHILAVAAGFAATHSGGTMVPVKYLIPDLRKAVRPIIGILFDNDAFKPAQEIMEENLEEQKGVMPEDYEGDNVMKAYFKGLALLNLFNFNVPFSIPSGHRVEHHMIVATPGHGKTTTLATMVLNDLKEDAGIMVIDSQGGLIDSLVTRIPADRVILIDPATCPPAMNIFDRKLVNRASTNDVLMLYDYIFSSMGQDMTGKQSGVYRNLARLCMAIPGATLHTLRGLLTDGGLTEHADLIAAQSQPVKDFFAAFQAKTNNQYGATRAEILVRLDAILLDGPFSDMLAAKTMRLNIPEALAQGKVILVNTNTRLLGEASNLMGRIFIGQVMQACRARDKWSRKRVYLYCDEFGDYANDHKLLTDCFSQGRQYELAMIVCFQLWGQLPTKMAEFIAGCTAIKFAGGVSSLDVTNIAKQMRTTVENINAQPKGTFLAFFKDIGVLPWKVTLGGIDRIPEITDRDEVIENMRTLYGDTVDQPTATEKADEVPSAPAPASPVRTPHEQTDFGGHEEQAAMKAKPPAETYRPPVQGEKPFEELF